MTGDVAIGIDLGGTKLAGAVVDASGNILARTQIPTRTLNEVTLVSGIAKLALELRASAPRAVRIGLAAAGLVDPRAGVIVTSPNLPTRNIGISSMISARTGLDVVLDNDANAAAFAEARVGAGVGARSVIAVTVGTGVGGGIVVDGNVMRGARGFAGEVGHIVIDRGGPPCACGANGCVEAFASGTAIARAARNRIEEPDAAALRQARDGGESIGAELVARLAGEGDGFSRSLLHEAGASLGIALVSLANLLDPDRIVIGGGAGSGLFETLIAPAREVLARDILGSGQRPVPDVVRAMLGADAGVVGAAMLAMSENME